MRNRIHLCLAHMSGKEKEYIKKALDTNWIVPIGPNVDAFEEELEKFINSQCIMHNAQLSRNAGNYELNKAVVALSARTHRI